jgi:hypothetical protein
MAGDDYRLNKKTYWHSRGVGNPPVSHIVIVGGDAMEWALDIMKPLEGRQIVTWCDFEGAIGRVANF